MSPCAAPSARWPRNAPTAVHDLGLAYAQTRPTWSELAHRIDRVAGVSGSLAIDTTALGTQEEGELLCFLVWSPGATLGDVEPRLRKALRSDLSPRHVPVVAGLVDHLPARRSTTAAQQETTR
ncbi:hypothetical protein [Streptomyces sp. NPDC059349]|uniref:hypothetical protein n=1 Tax=Streptomyces sp. NPDC059349 TaxID=3346808 RepID=UPI003674E0E1